MNNDGFHGFKVKPTSVKIGGTVTVTGVKNDELDILLPGGTSKDLKLDSNGHASFTEPLGKEGSFVISDFDVKNPHNIKVVVHA